MASLRDQPEEMAYHFEIPSKDFLSFNNPLGACKTCEGYGQVIGIDEDLVVPDKNLSVYEGCVQPWKGETMSEWKEEFIRMAIEYDFPVHRSYYELSEKEKSLLWDGNQKVQGINAFFKISGRKVLQDPIQSDVESLSRQNYLSGLQRHTP